MRKIAFSLAAALLVLTSLAPVPARISAETTFKLSIQAGNGMVRLSWQEIPDSVGYYVYRRVGEAGDYELMTMKPQLDTTFIDLNAPNDTIVCYYASSVDKTGLETAKSGEVCTTPGENFPKFAIPCNLSIIFQVDNTYYYVNGARKMMKSPVMIRENRTFLLFRHVVEEIGGEIKWDGTEKRVDINYKSVKIQLWINKSKAMVNGKEVPIDPTNPRVVPFIFNGYTYVPLRFPVTALGEGEVKWFGDTKQAVLLFPDRCSETIEGVLQRWSQEDSTGLLDGWNGDKHQFYLPEGIAQFTPVIGDCMRIVGKNDNPDYPGLLVAESAELIQCPQTGVGTWEGTVESVDATKPSFTLKTDKGKVLVVGDSSNDVLLNLIRRLTPGVCVRVTGSIANETVTATFIERIRCLRDTDNYSCNGKWVSGEVVSADCSSGIVILKANNGETNSYNIPDNADCLGIMKGQCFRACISTDDNPVLNLLFTFDCNSAECTGKYIKGKFIRLDRENEEIVVAQGELAMTISIEGIDPSYLVDATCVEACVIMVGDKPLALWVKPLKGDECRDCIETIQIKPLRVDCQNKIIYARQIGTDTILKIAFNSPEFCVMEVGQCYEICIDPTKDTPVALSYEKIECPNPCEGETITGRVTAKDCEKGSVNLSTADGDKTLNISKELCSKLTVSNCYKFCVTTNVAGVQQISNVLETNPDNCPPEQPVECTDSIIKAKIISSDCKNGKVKVKVIESPWGSGMTLELPVDPNMKGLCERLVPGKCYKACADTTNPFAPTLKSMEEIPCPPETYECNKTYKGKIGDMNCATDGRMVLVTKDNKINILIKGVDPCKDFKVGDCVEACVYEVPGAVPILVSMKSLPAGECEQPVECKTVVAKVMAVDCTNNILSLKTTEAVFRAVAKEADICKQIQEGMCIEACIDFSTQPYTLVSFKTAPSDKCPGECDEVVKIKVTSVWCSNKYIEGTEILTIEDRSPRTLKIRFDSEDFCKMIRGSCYEVCVSVNEAGEMVGLWFKEISCQETQDCEGRIVDTSIESLNCDAGQVTVSIDGRLMTFNMDVEVCSTLKPGLCVRLCVTRDETGAIQARIIKILSPENCAKCACEGRWIKVTVNEYDAQSGVAVVTDPSGSSIKMIVKDQNVMLNPNDCLLVCMTFDQNSNTWIAGKIIFLDGNQCQSCEGGYYRGVIKRTDCANGIVYVDIGGTEFTVKYTGADCQNLQYGDTVIFCAKRDAGQHVFISSWIKIIDHQDCDTCKGRKLMGKIEKYQPNALMEIQTSNGPIKFFTDNKQFIEMMTEGGCFEVCLVWDKDKKTFVLTGLKPLPPEVCENIKTCDGRKFRGTVVGEGCENGIIKVSIGKNLWKVNVSKTDFDCTQNIAGRCVEICGNYPTSTTDLGVILANYVKILPAEECSDSELETLTGVARKVDPTNNTAYLEKDRNFTKLETGTIVLKEGVCYQVIGYYVADGTLVVLDARELDLSECQWSCEGDTVTTQMLDYTNDGLARIVSSGSIIKVKLSDAALEILQKWAPDYFPLCVKLCLKQQAATTALPPVVTYLQILPASECKPVCSGQIMRGTIDSVDCETNRIVILDFEGTKQTITVNPNICTRLTQGMCVKICLSLTGKLPDGSFEAAWLEEDSTACGQNCQKITAKVYSVTCNATSVLIKCIAADGRYTITVNTSACKLYSDAKCIRFCLEVKDGKPTGKLVGNVEVLTEGSCADIPDPCDGKIVWNAKVVRLSCSSSKAYLNHGGMLREVTIDSELCQELTIGSCYRFCLELQSQTYTVIFFTPDTTCDLTCIEAKVSEYNSQSRRVIVIDSKNTKWMIQLPIDFTGRLYTGMCLRICGVMQNNMLSAQWVQEIKCTEQKSISFSGVVVGVDCRTRVIQVRTDAGDVYSVKLPDSFDCTTIKQGSCVSVGGTIDENGVVTAQKIVISECPQSWDVYVYDVICNTDRPYMVVRVGQNFYSAILPDGINCAALSSNTCVTITGYLRRSNTAVAVIYYIEVISVQAGRCTGTGPYVSKVLSTSCSGRYITVDRDGSEFKLFYPKSFDCSSIKQGMCVSYYGAINDGYIECYKIEVVSCPQTEVSYKFWMTENACANGYYLGFVNGVYYKVIVPKGYQCGANEGTCMLVTGTVDTSTKPPTITASKITYDRCPATSSFVVKVTIVPIKRSMATAPYIKVTYKDATYIMYSPIDLTQFKVGTCVAVSGWIGDGYICAVTAKATRCP